MKAVHSVLTRRAYADSKDIVDNASVRALLRTGVRTALSSVQRAPRGRRAAGAACFVFRPLLQAGHSAAHQGAAAWAGSSRARLTVERCSVVGARAWRPRRAWVGLSSRRPPSAPPKEENQTVERINMRWVGRTTGAARCAVGCAGCTVVLGTAGTMVGGFSFGKAKQPGWTEASAQRVRARVCQRPLGARDKPAKTQQQAAQGGREAVKRCWWWG